MRMIFPNPNFPKPRPGQQNDYHHFHDYKLYDNGDNAWAVILIIEPIPIERNKRVLNGQPIAAEKQLHTSFPPPAPDG